MENILVVQRSLLSPYIGANGVITGEIDKALDIISNNFQFMPRPEMEEDPSYKQIIPYVVICRGDEVFSTRRLQGGTEKRLHGLISLGIGGHINPGEKNEDGNVFMGGLYRELHEEVFIEGELGKLSFRGLINDDSNSVGRVHLGLFFTLEVSGEVRVLETEKLHGAWLKKSELKSLSGEMETWSALISPLIV